MTWIRSSACTVGSCVEVRHVDGHVEVRDNTAPDTVLHITPADWAAFLVGAKAGEFDGPAADNDQADVRLVVEDLDTIKAALICRCVGDRGCAAHDALARTAEAVLNAYTTPDES